MTMCNMKGISLPTLLFSALWSVLLSLSSLFTALNLSVFGSVPLLSTTSISPLQIIRVKYVFYVMFCYVLKLNSSKLTIKTYYRKNRSEVAI